MSLHIPCHDACQSENQEVHELLTSMQKEVGSKHINHFQGVMEKYILKMHFSASQAASSFQAREAFEVEKKAAEDVRLQEVARQEKVEDVSKEQCLLVILVHIDCE